ncbi:MAG: Crp/Fnr family transcriptional regulator [Candidatus Eiseniibacteriota bacterium]
MLTAVERVLILRQIDLLKAAGPRQLLSLAELLREVEVWTGQVIYQEKDAADALYVVVQGRVRLSADGRPLSEVGSGEAFGTWALVDDSERGQRAECIEDGLLVALDREEFYEFATGDTLLLRQIIHTLARRLRQLVVERPEEARVEGEGAQAETSASSSGAGETKEQTGPAG